MIAPRKLRIMGAAMAGLLSLPAFASATTVVCKELRLKPLHCVRGLVINTLGEFVPGAAVTIVEDGTAKAAAMTDEKGQFAFGLVEPGNYELRVETGGYLTEHIPIIVKKPGGKCKRALEIRLRLGYPMQCTQVRMVKR